MNDTQVEEVRQFMAKLGVASPSITHPTTTLEDLFMRVIRENTPVPGGSNGNADGNGTGERSAS